MKDGSGEEGTAHPKGLKKRPSLLKEFEESLPADFMPADKKRALITKEAVDVYIQPDQKDRGTVNLPWSASAQTLTKARMSLSREYI